MSKTYVSGHHDSVLSSHRWRTAANSAAYLLVPLEEHLKHLQTTRPSKPPALLDIGCGPGTITLDFARILAPYGGHVTGIDPSADVVYQAEQAAKDANVTNVTFTTGDAYSLAYEADTFDIIHTHQVLQHLQRPVDALVEMRRVCASGGLIASREVDFSAMAWWPLIPGIEAWRTMWGRVTRDDGTDADTGRKLLSLCLAAGFERARVTATAGTWCYSTPEERKWWGGLWAERVKKSDFAKKVVAKGFGTEEDLDGYAKAFREWMDSDDAWIALLHGEVVCRN